MSAARSRDVSPPRRGVRRRSRPGVLRALLGPQADLRHGGRLRSLPRAVHARGHRRARGRLRGRQSTTRSAASPICSPSPSTASWASRPSISATRSPTPRAAATIKVDGETIGLRQAGVVQANEADRGAPRPHPGGPAGRHGRAPQPAPRHALAPLPRPRRRARLPALQGAVLRGQGPGLRAPARRARAASSARRPASTSASWTVSCASAWACPSRELTYADLPYLWRAPGFDDVFTADAPRPHAAGHARRHGHRPRRPEQRAPRHGGPRAQVAARLLLAGARARRDLPRRPAAGRPGRLRGPAARGRAHRALRARPARPAVRVPAPRRQRRHRGLRLHLRPPRAQPPLARALPAVHRRRRLPALRHRQRPLLHAPLRRQARLRDGAARRRRARSRHGAAVRRRPERGRS